MVTDDQSVLKFVILTTMDIPVHIPHVIDKRKKMLHFMPLIFLINLVGVQID